MKMYWGVDVQLQASLAFTLDGGEWSASHSGHFTPRGRAHSTHWIGGWIGLRAGLDTVAKRQNPCLSNAGHPPHSLVSMLTELPWLLDF